VYDFPIPSMSKIDIGENMNQQCVFMRIKKGCGMMHLSLLVRFRTRRV